MKNAKQVDELVKQLTAAGKSKAEIVWQTALACVGWPYVYGSRGEYCTVQNRHARYSDSHPTIRTKCKGYDSGSCSGCSWYAGSERVRMYDCRGFTYWCLRQVGIPLEGAGATSQWNNADNWSKKGDIKNLPKGTLVCLFVRKDNKMEHTGFGLDNETVECSSGVQHFTTRKAKWTHWAIPKNLYDVDPEPTPDPKPDKGTAIVTGKNLALRQGPSTSCSIITRAPTGSTVKIENVPDDWEYVEYKGKKGFMMKQYLKEGD